jgi:hypothetical protein
MPKDLTGYPHAMTIDPETGKPMPKSAVQLPGRILTDKDEVKVSLQNSGIILPVEAQVVQNNAITLFASKAVNTMAWDTSAPYVNVSECSRIAVNTKVDSNKPFKVDLYWSEDGINVTTVQSIVDKTGQWDSQVIEVREPWVKVAPYNGDTVTRTFEIKGYKKTL